MLEDILRCRSGPTDLLGADEFVFYCGIVEIKELQIRQPVIACRLEDLLKRRHGNGPPAEPGDDRIDRQRRLPKRQLLPLVLPPYLSGQQSPR